MRDDHYPISLGKCSDTRFGQTREMVGKCLISDHYFKLGYHTPTHTHSVHHTPIHTQLLTLMLTIAELMSVPEGKSKG